LTDGFLDKSDAVKTAKEVIEAVDRAGLADSRDPAGPLSEKALDLQDE
jgi:hypothetical protein